MPAARIICPGCGTTLTSAQTFEAGKLVDCPSCRLLFAPTANDLASQRVRSFELATEKAWAGADVSRPSRSPFSSHRRFRGFSRAELGIVGVACLLVMASAGVVVGIYYLGVRGAARPAASKALPAQPPAAAGETSSPLPAGRTEVEDDRALPPKPVPSLDDDPPGKPPP